jgi:hypothetical protein
MKRRVLLMLLVVTLALVLTVSLAGAALAATPASDGAGQAFGQHHADMAQQGGLGQDMNPGMHQGFTGWPPPVPPA